MSTRREFLISTAGLLAAPCLAESGFARPPAGSSGTFDLETGSSGGQRAAEPPERRKGFVVPRAWTRRGVVLKRENEDSGVSGDPCIVWDEAIKGWRMVLFYSPP